MNARLTRTLLTVLAILCLAMSAQAAWISNHGAAEAAPTVSVTDTGANRTEVEITIPGITTETVTIDGTTYTKVIMPGHVQLLDRGAPQLPYITTSLIIADQGTPQLRILDTQYREIATSPVVPSKGAIMRTVDPSTVPYAFGTAYQGGVFPAETASLADPYIVRDMRGVNVRLFPVQWDADRGVLRILESVTYEVVTEGSGGINANTTTFNQIGPAFNALYAQKFENYTAQSRYDMPTTDGPMLIVCYDAFVGAMQPFIDWKMQRGLDVELITTSSVGGNTTGIKAAIQERYDSAEGLAMVILVGDGPQVPHYTGAYEGANDDTKYMRLDGSDVYPDALISRISASNATQVSTQVVKFVEYERDVAGPADWTHKAIGIASNEGSPTDAERMNWLRTDLLAYNFTDVDQIYQGQGGSTAGIANAVNEGRSLLNYLGHGSGTSWSSVPFNNSNVHQLTNTAWPWIIDVACLNGGISAIGESFAEAWMRAGSPEDPHGCVGTYSSSTSCPWVPPTVMQTEAMDLLCAETANILGVLCHAGIMAVLDEYGTSGTGLQLVEQYNLFGDCSLMVRTDSPNNMTVAHQPVVPLFTPTFAVDTGVANTSVTLSGNGVVYGTGTTDAFGFIELNMTHDVDTVGPVTLTAFGYNQETYQVELLAIVPADIVIEPATVPVGVQTPVTVTITDPDDGSGMDNIMVDIVGFGFSNTPVQTDSNGQVVINVTGQFGEDLKVRGQEIGETYYLFGEALPVTGAMVLGNPQVTASVPSIGMDGTLTPHIEGQIEASMDEAGFSFLLSGGGLEISENVSGSSLTMPTTPVELSNIVATLTKAGYDIFQKDIEVVEAFGTYAGTVFDGDDMNLPLAGVRVYGFAEGDDPSGTPLFDLTTGADGTFSFAEELAVAYYDVYVEKFGYMPYSEVYFLLYGANDHGITVAQAPSGLLTGSVTAYEDGTPLDATVRVYRTDNNELYNEVTTDASGVYTTGALPYFDYRVVVRSFRRIPAVVEVSIMGAEVTANFSLEPTEGDLLVLDDNSGSAARSVPAKYDTNGTLLAPAYEMTGSRAAADLVSDLEDLGYTASLENATSSDPMMWADYDLIILSSGDNTSPLGNAALRTNIESFHADGGKLLVEGGEVAYDMQYNDSGFLSSVLRVDDWNGDSSGDLSVGDASHPIMSVPNMIVGPISNDYSGYGDADRAVPTAAGHLVGNWTAHSSDASVIAWDSNDDPVGGDFAFFLFNYSAMGAERSALLHNTVNWLIANESGGTTPVADERIPTVLTLQGNYPNPFNPATVIKFSVPSDQQVELAVYDVRGQKLRTLVSEVMVAGSHEVTWQGRDDSGRHAASGMYFYRLTTEGQSLVKKMMLLK